MIKTRNPPPPPPPLTLILISEILRLGCNDSIPLCWGVVLRVDVCYAVLCRSVDFMLHYFEVR